MLIFGRRESERVLIGDNVVMTIVRVAGGGVRVGFEAPKNVRIMRAEVVPEEAREAERRILAAKEAEQAVAPLPALVIPTAPLAAFTTK